MQLVACNGTLMTSSVKRLLLLALFSKHPDIKVPVKKGGFRLKDLRAILDGCCAWIQRNKFNGMYSWLVHGNGMQWPTPQSNEVPCF